MNVSIIGLVIICAALGFVIVSSLIPNRQKPTSRASAASNDSAQRDAGKYEDPRKTGSNAEWEWREPISADWETVLGVTHSATAAEIKKAYLALVQQYHPDRFTAAAPEIAEYGAATTKAINAAYLTARRLGRG